MLPEAARWAGNLTLAMIVLRDWDGAEVALQEALALKPEPRSRMFLDLNAAAIAQGRGKLEEARANLRIYTCFRARQSFREMAGSLGTGFCVVRSGRFPRRPTGVSNRRCALSKRISPSSAAVSTRSLSSAV